MILPAAKLYCAVGETQAGCVERSVQTGGQGRITADSDPKREGSSAGGDQCGAGASGGCAPECSLLALFPEDIIRAGEDARLRITGTATGDVRRELGDRPRRAGRRRRAGRLRARSEPDPGIRRLRLKTEESATIRADIHVHALEFAYLIGDVVTRIAGRNLSLNRNAPDAETKKYLQITSVLWDVRGSTRGSAWKRSRIAAGSKVNCTISASLPACALAGSSMSYPCGAVDF